jgi:hypothetical protein
MFDDEKETIYDDVPYPRYKWAVAMEMKPIIVYIEADTAEEAMEIAQDVHQLKGMPLDDIPELDSVSAQITGVTEMFADIMDKIKNA